MSPEDMGPLEAAGLSRWPQPAGRSGAAVPLSGGRQPRPQPVKQHFSWRGQSVSSLQELLQGAKVCSTFLLGQTPGLAAGGKGDQLMRGVCPGRGPSPAEPPGRPYLAPTACSGPGSPCCSTSHCLGTRCRCRTPPGRRPSRHGPPAGRSPSWLGVPSRVRAPPAPARSHRPAHPRGAHPRVLRAGSNRHPCPATPEGLRAGGSGAGATHAGPCG